MSGAKGKEDRKFAQISPDTVNLIADTLGFSHLDQRVSRALAEDTSYRCREIVNVCAQVLKHSKRRRLTTRDVDRAFEVSDVDPVLGHDNGNDPQDFVAMPDVSRPAGPDQPLLHVAQERVIELRPFALGQSPPIFAAEPGIQAAWLTVEGHFYPENEEAKPVEFPQQSNLTPALVQYYQALSNIILGDSDEMVKTIISDIRTNSKIGTLLPFLVCFIRNGMQRHCDNRVLMSRLLSLLQAVFSNTSLNLSPKPYLSHLVTALLSSLIVDRPTKQPSQQNPPSQLTLNIDHVQHASQILRQVLDRWATPVNQLRSQTHRALREYLKDDKISYTSHYGALSAMIALGPDVLEECLLPQLEAYARITSEKLEEAASSQKEPLIERQKRKCVLNLMWGTLAAAVRILMKHLAKRGEGDVYRLFTETFGDSLAIASDNSIRKRSPKGAKARAQKTGLNIHGASGLKAHRHAEYSGKLRIRRLNHFNPQPFEARQEAVPVAVEPHVATKSSSSFDFNFLADFGMPNDIFEPGSKSADAGSSCDILSEGSGRLSSLEDRIPLLTSSAEQHTRLGCDPPPVSDLVVREFELDPPPGGGQLLTVAKHRGVGGGKITLSLPNSYRWPQERLRRPKRSNIHSFDSRNAPRSAAIGGRMGSASRKGYLTEDQLSSCCISSVL